MYLTIFVLKGYHVTLQSPVLVDVYLNFVKIILSILKMGGSAKIKMLVIIHIFD